MSDSPWTLGAADYDDERVSRAAESRSVAVVIPARDEEATLGAVLEAVGDFGDLEEVVVVDDHSRDGTADVARRHGARVVTLEGAPGKGAALRAGARATTSELLVFLDADVVNTTREFVGRLLQPLLEEPRIHLVKGYYQRPLGDQPSGGGRVTELTARPILALLFPDLREIRQPLAGETALRRSVLDVIDLEHAYGVEIALLIDVARRFGVGSLAQVDLGVRRHRNRPLEELRPMAGEVLRAALLRFGFELPPAD